MACYRPIIPQVYDDAYTYYEQLCGLQKALKDTLEWVDEKIAGYEDTTDEKIKKAVDSCNSYSDEKNKLLYEQIERELTSIKLDGCFMIDPWTGKTVPVSNVVEKIVATTKTGALTAIEYDNLELTAKAYDDKQLTAYQYDWLGKTLLP